MDEWAFQPFIPVTKKQLCPCRCDHWKQWAIVWDTKAHAACLFTGWICAPLSHMLKPMSETIICNWVNVGAFSSFLKGSKAGREILKNYSKMWVFGKAKKCGMVWDMVNLFPPSLPKSLCNVTALHGYYLTKWPSQSAPEPRSVPLCGLKSCK